MPGRLTTQVLDISRGGPAVGMLIDLFRVGARPNERQHLKTVETNEAGATDAPLLEGEAFAAGAYEMLFHVGRYFRATEAALSAPPFLDVVPVRFGVAEPDESCHVPLLVGPFAYATYRGR